MRSMCSKMVTNIGIADTKYLGEQVEVKEKLPQLGVIWEKMPCGHDKHTHLTLAHIGDQTR